MLLIAALMVVAAAAEPSGELFQDKGDFFVRARRTRGIEVGAQLKILGAFIGNTGERRTAGKVTVLELWPELARVSLDAGARAAMAQVLDGETLGVVELPDEIHLPEPAAPRYGSVFIDPLGFLTFGPVIGLEVGAGRAAGAIYGRWLSGGLVSNTTALLGSGEAYDFSFGLGARFRFYFRDNLAGAHLGAAVEWLRTVVRNERLLLILTSNYLVPQFEGGYRWASDRVFLDLAGSVGGSARLFWKLENLPGGQLASSLYPTPITGFFASAKLELGVFF